MSSWSWCFAGPCTLSKFESEHWRCHPLPSVCSLYSLCFWHQHYPTHLPVVRAEGPFIPSPLQQQILAMNPANSSTFPHPHWPTLTRVIFSHRSAAAFQMLFLLLLSTCSNSFQNVRLQNQLPFILSSTRKSPHAWPHGLLSSLAFPSSPHLAYSYTPGQLPGCILLAFRSLRFQAQEQALPNPFSFHLIASFPWMDSPGHYLRSFLYLLVCWAVHLPL